MQEVGKKNKNIKKGKLINRGTDPTDLVAEHKTCL